MIIPITENTRISIEEYHDGDIRIVEEALPGGDAYWRHVHTQKISAEDAKGIALSLLHASGSQDMLLKKHRWDA